MERQRTVISSHVQRSGVDEAVALLQLSSQQLSAAEEVNQMIRVHWNGTSCYIAAIRIVNRKAKV